MEINTPDSLIFDMDGTLWDALDTYTFCWNSAFLKLEMDIKTTREELRGMMGWEKEKVLAHFFKGMDHQKAEYIFEAIVEIQDEVLPQKGGLIYPDVKEGLKALSQKYKLFILSNCPKDSIKQFMFFAGIEDFITAEIAYGFNNQPKHKNMLLLKEKYALKNPIYIGDTDHDSKETSLAGFPFAHVTYGFGTTQQFDVRFDSFKSLTDYFLEID
ncbi:MAG: HAD family hydrolase [Pedobacter sp.]|nr:HAD family hydrolase [Pedobacter sp.]